VGSKLVAITAIGSRLILVICSPGELPDLGQVQAERVDPARSVPTLHAVHDPRKISVDLAGRVGPGTATTQITEIRRQSLTLMAAILSAPTLLREGCAPMTSAPVRDPFSDHSRRAQACVEDQGPRLGAGQACVWGS